MGKKNTMNMARLVMFACAFFIVTTGCTLTHEMAQRAPVAQTPALYKVLKPGPSETRVIPNLKGEYEILPCQSIIIQINTKYLSDLQVDIDGDVLTLADDPERQRELEAQDMGYYTSKLNKDLSTHDLANWEITVYPPPSKRKGDGFNINIRSISLNPKYTGIDKVSVPLTIRVVREQIRESKETGK